MKTLDWNVETLGRECNLFLDYTFIYLNHLTTTKNKLVQLTLPVVSLISSLGHRRWGETL